MSWAPDPDGFLADLETKPTALRRLAEAIGSGAPWPRASRRVVMLGMGSSWFAAQVGAARLRALGIDAVAERASAAAASPGGPGTLAVAISASGATTETVGALRRHRERGSVGVALTNEMGSAIVDEADAVVDMVAGAERGGVACRSFQHTLVRLLELEARHGGSVSPAEIARRAAEATEDLLERRDAWLPVATELLTATGQSFLIAPAERLSSAEQGALMLREGPRLVADACESGDWLHVDVYLTKPLDYRALLFVGSSFDDEVMRWMAERGSTVIAVGGDLAGARATVRYVHDDDPQVALIAETIAPELVAHLIWSERVH